MNLQIVSANPVGATMEGKWSGCLRPIELLGIEYRTSMGFDDGCFKLAKFFDLRLFKALYRFSLGLITANVLAS
jgi:hypothetical protein